MVHLIALIEGLINGEFELAIAKHTNFTYHVGVSCEKAAVEDVSSNSSWNGVSCTAQVCPSRPGCQELHVRH